MNLLINPRTEPKITVIAKDAPHAILLTGKPGVGLATIARSIAAKNLTSVIRPIDSKEQDNYESGTISVETIRQLYDKTRAKQTKPSIFVLDNAERMSLGAQAAFLKLLEEPGTNIHFFLTSHFPQKLLPTVLSRVQTVTVDPITASQTSMFLNEMALLDAKKRKQLEYLATGLPAELTRLINDEKYFNERAKVMADTRAFLTGSTYQKLLVVHEYHKERTKVLQLIDSALTVTTRSMKDRPQSSIAEQMDTLLLTRDKIEANCNTKLQLTAFVLQ